MGTIRLIEIKNPAKNLTEGKSQVIVGVESQGVITLADRDRVYDFVNEGQQKLQQTSQTCARGLAKDLVPGKPEIDVFHYVEERGAQITLKTIDKRNQRGGLLGFSRLLRFLQMDIFPQVTGAMGEEQGKPTITLAIDQPGQEKVLRTSLRRALKELNQILEPKRR